MTTRWLTGSGPLDRVVSNIHILQAVSNGLMIAALVIAVLAIILFPPAGAVALAGGGVLLAGSAALSVELLATAVVLGTAGIMLSQAANSSGQSFRDSSSGGSSGSSAGESGRPSNADQFPARSFENTEYSMDELASMTHRHTGSGDVFAAAASVRLARRDRGPLQQAAASTDEEISTFASEQLGSGRLSSG